MRKLTQREAWLKIATTLKTWYGPFGVGLCFQSGRLMDNELITPKVRELMTASILKERVRIAKKAGSDTSHFAFVWPYGDTKPRIAFCRKMARGLTRKKVAK